MNALIRELQKILPERQVITDELRRLAYGTDASFYRMTPEVVAVVESEADVAAVLRAANLHGRSVTFRAAGTSLSGQAITHGILALAGEGFATCEISPDAALVRAGPAMIGGDVNRKLAPHGRKIGPDPASINACKIGGIAANNASGMCCGTAQNSYRTLAGMRLILVDGTLLDTEDAESVARFRVSHAAPLDALRQMGEATRADAALAARIRHKFKIKNTTGYSLNALVDYEDPIDILTHLMIGSEGTLGFMSRITYRTVADDPHKASALVFFPDIEVACKAVILLKQEAVSAVELLDRAALRSVEQTPGLPPQIRTLGSQAAALLIEVRAETAQVLNLRIDAALAAVARMETVEAPSFSTDPATCDMYWKVRKGTFPSVGAMRRAGTTVIIEDVAFPIKSLAAATLDLQALLQRHGYSEAIIFGHALEGNLHFVFTQDFSTAAEVERYARFMDEVCTLVVEKYDGSLKAEHGTGRNMAPFVELEWGRQATDLMRGIKQLLDPETMLNPGVILNDDAQAHLQHLKPMPEADSIIDRCIECGFCEPQCPSHQLTTSPRQRIVLWRELTRRAASGEDGKALESAFGYNALDTCAGCGLCSSACPVSINTGDLVRDLRGRALSPLAQQGGHWGARHFGTVVGGARLGLRVGHAAASLLGEATVARLSGGAWKRGMPQPGKSPAPSPHIGGGDPVVYFPACGGRMFGPSESGQASLSDTVVTLLDRAGYAARLPQDADRLCCGQMLASKGMVEDADRMTDALIDALFAAADDGLGGHHPVVMDASACSARIRTRLAGRLRLYDLHEFAHDALLPRLTFQRKPEPIALHVNCSVRRSASEDKLRRVVAACAETVIEPEGVGCCGFGGDRGFAVPELNAHALRRIQGQLPSTCSEGVSTNRTCEIGLTAETGVTYHSIAYLLEECSRDGVAR
jgi:D-lactate dehydrogenase